MTTPPSLIESARWLIEQWRLDDGCTIRPMIELEKAIEALPPDPVICSASYIADLIAKLEAATSGEKNEEV